MAHLTPALTAVTDFTRDAERILRDPDQFKWYTVTLIGFVTKVCGGTQACGGVELHPAPEGGETLY